MSLAVKVVCNGGWACRGKRTNIPWTAGRTGAHTPVLSFESIHHTQKPSLSTILSGPRHSKCAIHGILPSATPPPLSKLSLLVATARATAFCNTPTLASIMLPCSRTIVQGAMIPPIKALLLVELEEQVAVQQSLSAGEGCIARC